MTNPVMSVMKNTPKVWFGFIFFRPDSVTNQKNLSISKIWIRTGLLFFHTRPDRWMFSSRYLSEIAVYPHWFKNFCNSSEFWLFFKL